MAYLPSDADLRYKSLQKLLLNYVQLDSFDSEIASKIRLLLTLIQRRFRFLFNLLSSVNYVLQCYTALIFKVMYNQWILHGIRVSQILNLRMVRRFRTLLYCQTRRILFWERYLRTDVENHICSICIHTYMSIVITRIYFLTLMLCAACLSLFL